MVQRQLPELHGRRQEAGARLHGRGHAPGGDLLTRRAGESGLAAKTRWLAATGQAERRLGIDQNLEYT